MNQTYGTASVEALTHFINEELFKVIGASASGWMRQLFALFFALPARRFAQLGADFDQKVAECGFYEAARWVLPRFVRQVVARGAENIPGEGPLLVAANHPGIYDSLVIAAQISRPDLKILAREGPFLRNLPSTAQHLIYIARDPFERMAALRAAIRHLQQDGALLLFPSGTIDPDPALQPGSEGGIERWSPSLELFLRKVPETRALLAVISGVLDPGWMRSPLTRPSICSMLHIQQLDRQRIAEFLQVAQHLIWPRSLLTNPVLSFSPPLCLAELSRAAGTAGALGGLVEKAKALLAEHVASAAPAPAGAEPGY